MSKLTKVSTVSNFLTMLFLTLTVISIIVDATVTANLTYLVLTLVLITLFFTLISDLLESYIYYSSYNSDKKRKKLITASYVFQVLFMCVLYIFALTSAFTSHILLFDFISILTLLILISISDFLSNLARVKYKHTTRLTLIVFLVISLIGLIIFK